MYYYRFPHPPGIAVGMNFPPDFLIAITTILPIFKTDRKIFLPHFFFNFGKINFSVWCLTFPSNFPPAWYM